MDNGYAFANGLRAHGLEPQIIHSFYGTECDLAVFSGWHRQTQIIRNRQQIDGNHFISMDVGYLGNPAKWRSIGFDGQNGRANFCINENMPATRRNKYHWNLKPWNPGSEHVLVCAQDPNETALRGLNHDAWIRDTIAELETIVNVPVKLRPPPDPQMSHKAAKSDLTSDLTGAMCVVAYNSNAAVDAILAGIPAIVLDQGAMAWPMCGHSLESVLDPPMLDREQWLNNLSFCQWSIKEIETGLAWDHLENGPMEITP
jgi:hypothetical protein